MEAKELSSLVYSEKKDETELQIAKTRLQKYKHEAKLIITTRLHCALPCFALGIPTILTREIDALTQNLTFVDKLMPIQSPSRLPGIDLYSQLITPAQINFKTKIKSLITQRMRGIIPSELINEIHTFYETRNEFPYIVTCDYSFLDNFLSRCDEYSIYGLSNDIEVWYSYLSKNYTKKKLLRIYDKNKSGFHFKHFTTEPIENMKKYPEEYIIISALRPSVICEMKNYLLSIGKDPQTFAYKK